MSRAVGDELDVDFLVVVFVEEGRDARPRHVGEDGNGADGGVEDVGYRSGDFGGMDGEGCLAARDCQGEVGWAEDDVAGLEEVGVWGVADLVVGGF